MDFNLQNSVHTLELFTDFHVTGKESIEREIEEYIKFFNEERPAYALGYMTPKQFFSIKLQLVLQPPSYIIASSPL